LTGKYVAAGDVTATIATGSGRAALATADADHSLLGRRSALLGRYDEDTYAKEDVTSEAAFSGDRDAAPGRDEFHRSHPLSELLAGAEPLDSVDELRIGTLADEEAETFLAALQR
jgi:hypothetical protein